MQVLGAEQGVVGVRHPALRGPRPLRHGALPRDQPGHGPRRHRRRLPQDHLQLRIRHPPLRQRAQGTLLTGWVVWHFIFAIFSLFEHVFICVLVVSTMPFIN